MSNPIRLALVSRRYPPLIGGAEKVLSYLANALAAAGADVTVLTSQLMAATLTARAGEHANATISADQKEHGKPGSLTVVRLRSSPWRFWGTWLYMRNLRRWFHDNPTDLAYVSMLKHDAYVVIASANNLAFPLCFDLKAPVRRAISHGSLGLTSAAESAFAAGMQMRSWPSPSPSRRSCEQLGLRHDALVAISRTDQSHSSNTIDRDDP